MNHTESLTCEPYEPESRAFTQRRNQLDDLAEFGIEVEPPVVTRRPFDAHSTPWLRYAPITLWIGICVAGILACGFAWIGSAVIAWIARTAPVWALRSIEATIFLAGAAVALACISPRKSH